MFSRRMVKLPRPPDVFILIDTFEKQCVVFKGILQQPQQKDSVQTIGIVQFLSNNDIY